MIKMNLVLRGMIKMNLVLMKKIKMNLVLTKMIKMHLNHTIKSGKFRGATYNICNLRYKTPRKIPTVFHNGSTSDYHFIISSLTK